MDWQNERTLTSIFLEERLADQVKELNLNTTEILPNLCTLHFAQSYPQRL